MAGPVISVRDASVMEQRSGSSRLEFRIALDTAPTAPVTIRYALLDVTADSNDYSGGTSVITIPAGQRELVLPISIYGDTRSEGNETFSLVLTSATNGVFPGGAAALIATGTILESGTVNLADARPIFGPAPAAGAGTMPTLDIRSVAVLEGDSGSQSARFLVTLDRVTTAPVTFAYFTQDRTAADSSDFGGGSSSITIEAGQQSAFINISTYGDTRNEGPESFQLVATSVQGARFADNAAALIATATIIDGDDGATGVSGGIGSVSERVFGPPTLSATVPAMRVSNPAVIEGANGSTTLRYLVTFDRVLESPVSFNTLVQGGTAVAGSDFGDGGTRVTFNAGIQSSWLNVSVYGDTALETNESVRLILSGINNAFFEGGAAALVATGTIIDDDSGDLTLVGTTGDSATQVFGLPSTGNIPTISVVSTSIAEANSGSNTVGVYLLLSRASATDVTIQFQTLDGTALQGSDYSRNNGTYTIPAGSLSQYIPITVFGDTNIEGDESFIVRVTNPSGATFAGGATSVDATVVIRDNDGGGTAGQFAGPSFPVTGRTGSAGNDVILGTSQIDILSGGLGDDVIRGDAGNDILAGNGGDDVIDGGEGTDSAAFAVIASAATIQYLADGSLRLVSAEGTDTLTSIETLRFTDRDVATARFGEIDATYRTVGGRGAALSELIVWTDQIAAGRTIADVRSAIVGDALGASAIDAVYRDGFGRAANQGEIATWRGLFTRGADLATLRSTIAAEVAPLTATVNTLYDKYAGRAAAAGELSFWRGQLIAGVSADTIKAAIVDDPAGAATIDRAYADLFGRSAAATEIAVWRDLFKRGADANDLRAAILSDPAGQAHTSGVIAATYRDLGGRAPSAGETQTWLGILARGGDYGDLRAAILGDPLGDHATGVIRGYYADYFGRAASGQDVQVWRGLFATGTRTDTLLDTLMTQGEATAGGVRTVAAGPNADTIAFGTAEHLVVTGFNPAADTIDLRGSPLAGANPLASAREIVAFDGRRDVLIDTPTHDLLLTGVTLAQLSAADFLF